VPQTTGWISAVNRPKFTILWGHVEMGPRDGSGRVRSGHKIFQPIWVGSGPLSRTCNNMWSK